MVLKSIVDRFYARLGRLGLLCLAILAGLIAMLMAARPADASTNPCSDLRLQSASVQSTLQVKFHGVDSPTITSITQITIPEDWEGTSRLFGDGQQQGSSLNCFMPIDQWNYQSAPPEITVDPPTHSTPAKVKISNTITVTDGPEVDKSWDEGLWSVSRRIWGYQVVFKPHGITSASGHGPWTVTLNAPELNIGHPSRLPSTYDKHRTLMWSFPPSQQKMLTQQQQLSRQQQQLSRQQQQLSLKQLLLSWQQQQLSWQQQQLSKKLQQLSWQQQQLSKKLQLPKITVSLYSPWQVRMNLSTYRWPTRWFSDASWTLSDGILIDTIALWASLRLLHRKPNSSKKRLPISVIFVSLLSIACYVGYVIDDHLWHSADRNTVWKYENLALVAAAAAYFSMALGARWRRILVTCVLSVATTWFILWGAERNLEDPPLYFYYGYVGAPHGTAWVWLVVLMIPLLCAIAFMGAGTVLWVSRLWPFGATKWRGLLRDRRDTPFRSWRIIPLVLGMLILAAFILGQNAAASYYYWHHSDLWGKSSSGAFPNVASNVLNGAHWWIGDGIQWSLYFAIIGGIFAVLYAMSADARGVFFGARVTSDLNNPPHVEPKDRGDLALMTVIAASLFVGTWGFYDGVWVPLPFIVTATGLAVCGLTRKLSKLDWKSKAEGLKVNSKSVKKIKISFLVTFRNALFAASARASTAVKSEKDTSASASEASAANLAPDNKVNALQAIIPLEPKPSDGHHVQIILIDPPPTPPKLKLPKKVDPGVTALELGPADTWWDNGMTAVRAGKYLAVIPAAVDIYINWRAGDLSQLGWPFGLQDALGIIVSIIIAWQVGLFMFGILLPYLRGSRAPIKGVIFGLIAFAAYTADAAVRHALNVSPYNTFVMDGLFAIALFMTVGLLLDIRTLRNHSDDQGLIRTLYRLESVRVAVTYATTLIVVGVGIWQTVYITNQTAQERAQNISNTAQYLNNVGGTANSSPGQQGG